MDLKKKVDELVEKLGKLPKEDQYHIVEDSSTSDLLQNYRYHLEGYLDERDFSQAEAIENFEACNKELDEYLKKLELPEQEKAVRATEAQGVEWKHLNLFATDFSPSDWCQVCDTVGVGYDVQSITVPFPTCLVRTDED